MKNHVYDFKNVVVGHSLEAVQHAYYNGYPIILNSKKVPFRFDEVESRISWIYRINYPGILI